MQHNQNATDRELIDRLETRARIVLWNIFKSRGMTDDSAYAAIKLALREVFDDA